ncbi:MAG: class I SAM-dependent methyltransferase [Lachnospiraceae bacterium]|nr:class I SAM-dependent methyltransferase [Ruminococcus sp.]MCM1276404.1 class I SAM-dependent methyltransferase [Lachnospiraceae bacterium]
MITLDNRLAAAAELCRNGKTAVDVGCDHAQLACRLAMDKSALVIASDVRDGPLEAARRTVSECGAENVRIVKSDGLAEIDFADDVIICGMGGELIARIIGGCRFLSGDTRFILQPMTRADFLRKWLYGHGFELLEERTAYDGGRGYTVMLAAYTSVPREIDELFALTGKITDGNFLRKIAEKLSKNADGMEKSQSGTEQAESLRELSRKVLEKSENLGKRF